MGLTEASDCGLSLHNWVDTGYIEQLDRKQQSTRVVGAVGRLRELSVHKNN
jgi:hypothetical protein